jgi:hypothetical protein
MQVGCTALSALHFENMQLVPMEISNWTKALAKSLLPGDGQFSHPWALHQNHTRDKTDELLAVSDFQGPHLPGGAQIIVELWCNQSAFMAMMLIALQVLHRKLDARSPIIESKDSATRMAQLMTVIQQHHHPLQCRSYVIPCFLTSSTSGSVRLPALCCCCKRCPMWHLTNDTHCIICVPSLLQACGK